MSGKYLKPDHYYSDLYDRFTVENCRRIEKLWDEEDFSDIEDKKVTKKEKEALHKYGKTMRLYFEIGERYLKRAETIREWKERDKNRDELLENAQPPEDIRCLACRNRVAVSFKELWTELDKEDRVLFMFDCPNKCMPRRAFFSDGEEWRVKPDLCPNCDGVLKIKEEKKDGDKIITIHKCSKCDYIKTDEIKLNQLKDESVDENFSVDRDRFCLTDEEGGKYREEKYSMEQLGNFMKEWEEKDKQRAEKLKANPKGFHLEGRGYTCGICGRHTEEGDAWYDKYGIKCLVCQKAIDEGEIPALLTKNEDSWYIKYDFEKFFNVKGPTLRSWIRKGFIKPRNISYYGKGSWYELFMIEDNKDFLPPKKMLESQRGTIEEDGKKVSRLFPWYCFVDPVKHLKGYKIMDHLRVLTPEEVKQREAEKKEKERIKDERRERLRAVRAKKKGKK